MAPSDTFANVQSKPCEFEYYKVAKNVKYAIEARLL